MFVIKIDLFWTQELFTTFFDFTEWLYIVFKNMIKAVSLDNAKTLTPQEMDSLLSGTSN